MWKERIEAQIAMHRAGELCMPDVCGYRPTGCPCTDTADAMQALLDLAVAAGLLTDSLRVVEERDDRNLSNATKLARQNDALLRLRVALDKLREAGDE